MALLTLLSKLHQFIVGPIRNTKSTRLNIQCQLNKLSIYVKAIGNMNMKFGEIPYVSA